MEDGDSKLCPLQGASGVEQGEADIEDSNSYQNASGLDQGEADIEVQVNYNSEYVSQNASCVDQGEADIEVQVCYNSEKKYVCGPSPSASVQQEETSIEVQVDHNSKDFIKRDTKAQVVDHHKSEKSERDEGMILMTPVMGMKYKRRIYPPPQLKFLFWLSLISYFSPIAGSSGDVQILSGPTVSYVGARATITCSESDIVNVQWLVNGTLDDGLNMNVVSDFSPITHLGHLLFREVLMEYNGTTIQCRANSSSGSITYSNIITMLVQGLLSAVGDLSAIALDSTISLTWNPPFTLDITDVDPDITYRVDVINSTSSLVIHSQGGITITQYNYTTSLSPERRACDVFKFTITPVNRVGNGNEFSISKGFLNVVPFVLSRHANLINGSFSFHIRMSAMVCGVDLVTISILSVQDVIITINDSDRTTIEITSASLQLNRHYDVTLDVSNSAGSNNLNQTLSTHDVQYTDIENSTVNISYVKNTKAKGTLCILISIHGGHVDFDSSVFIFIRRNEEFPIIVPLPGRYDVTFYDVESNGRLLPGVGYPAYVQKISIIQTGSVFIRKSLHLKNCDVSHSNGNILASCEFSSTSIASGFQIILQFSDPTNVESVRRLLVGQTLDRNTSVSVSVNKSGTYCAIIFAILNETILDEFPSYSMEFTVNVQDGTETSSQITITGPDPMPNDSLIGVLIAVVVVLFLILVGIVISFGLYYGYVRRKSKGINHDATGSKQEHLVDSEKIVHIDVE